MVKNNKAIIPKNPELLDMIIGEIQQGLVDNLGWLDKAFGRAERIIATTVSKKKIYVPAVYVKENDYVLLTPDSKIGNFCFFWVDDPQEINVIDHYGFALETDFSIIFWFDFRNIFNSKGNRNKESVKKQIMDVLNGGLLIRNGSIEINEVYELAENIYQGFSLDETEGQFLMHPYGGFRFAGRLKVNESCNSK